MRKLRQEEYDLIVFLLKNKLKFVHLINGLSEQLVEEMDDGGMGSLRFVSPKTQRRFGQEIAEATFPDEDNIPVSFAINLDEGGDLYELDVFEADFSLLKRFPAAPYNPIDQ